MRKTKEEQIFKINLKKPCWKLETNYVHCWKYETYSINAKIRNFKNEKILNFLIDPLIESGPDP